MSDRKISVHVTNKIYYYSTSLEVEKEGVLNSFNVNVVKTNKTTGTSFDWRKSYAKTLERIGN